MGSMKEILISLIFSCILIVAFKAPGMAWDDKTSKHPDAATPKDESEFNPGTWLASIYRDYISPVDGSRCPSEPSCSLYSVRAFKKHGFFMGWMMTMDRLLHEGEEETSVSPLVYSEGKWKIFDPLENNDFWWVHERKEDDK